MSSFAYFIKESLTGFTRNLSTALGSIVTIFLSLLIIGIFLVGGFVVERVVSSVESEVSITAYVADEASQNDIDKVMDYVRGLEGVQTVSFTTKDQALENFSQSSNSEIIDTLDGQNPLPASIDVELSDPQLVEQVADSLRSNSTYAGIADDDDPNESIKYGQKSVERLFTLTNYVRYIGIALIVLLIFIAMVFINNTIRLAGASNGFIRGPFLMEGAMHAVIGALLAVGVLELLRNLALPRLQEAIMFLSFDIGAGTFLFIYVVLAASGLLIGLIGSAFAMRRYLKV